MNLPQVIICDIDGTLALLGKRNRFDPTAGEDMVNYPIANILQVYDNQTVLPVDLILITGRESKYRAVTESWLQKHGVSHYKKLLCGRREISGKTLPLKRSYMKNTYKGNMRSFLSLRIGIRS